MKSEDSPSRTLALCVFIGAGIVALLLSGLGRTIEPARAGDRVRVEISLALQDGTPVLDQTQTTVLRSPNLVEGLWQGIVGMSPGQTERFTIAPEDAYGSRGRPGTIPANATLNAKVTLLRIEARANTDSD